MGIALAHITQPVPSLRAVNRGACAQLDAALGRALAKDPALRYARASEFVAALRAAGEGQAAPAGTPAGIDSAPIGSTASGPGGQPATDILRRPRIGLMLVGLGGLSAIAVCLVVALVVALPRLGGLAAGPAPTATPTEVRLNALVPTVAGTGIPATAEAPAATSPPVVSAPSGKVCALPDGSVEDRSYNQRMWVGVQQAAQEHNWEPAVLEPEQDGDYETHMDEFLQADCDLIVSLGFLLGDVTSAASKAHPDQKFQMPDYDFPDPHDNVWQQVYATDEGGFLAGYVAAAISQTGKVGAFGGSNLSWITDFMDGYALSVAYYNEQHGASVQLLGWDVEKREGLFTDDFDDQDKGREFGDRLLDEGADVIMPVAGPLGLGAAAAVQAHGNAYIIGVDTDWAVSAPEYASIVLTSVEKRLDLSVISAVEDVADGSFAGGLHLGTVENGEVGISPFHELDSLISDQVKADLEQIRAGIADGTIQTGPSQ